MKLYKQLVTDNQDLIAEIKNLQSKEKELRQALSQAFRDYESGEFDVDELWLNDKSDEIHEELSQVFMALQAAQAKLGQIVDEAYRDVPFEKPVKQGKRQFYELAGI